MEKHVEEPGIHFLQSVTVQSSLWLLLSIELNIEKNGAKIDNICILGKYYLE